jgi:hypothetical protein
MSTVQTNVKGFVHAIRHDDQDSYTATTEFIDNSNDNKTKKIDIQKKILGDGTYLAFRDDGNGIDETRFKKLAMLYDSDKTEDVTQCGEFGVGGRSAALYLGDKTIIVSKDHSNGFSETEFPPYNHDMGAGSIHKKLIKEIFGEYDEKFTYWVIRLREVRIPDFDDLDEYRQFLGSIYTENLSNNDLSISVNDVDVVPINFISSDSTKYSVTISNISPPTNSATNSATISGTYIKIDDNKGQTQSVNWYQPNIDMTNTDGTTTNILTQDLFENGRPKTMLSKAKCKPKDISAAIVNSTSADISAVVEFTIDVDNKLYSTKKNGYMISTTNMRNSTPLPIPTKRQENSTIVTHIRNSRIKITMYNKDLNKQSNKSRQYDQIDKNFKNIYVYNVVAFLFQIKANQLKTAMKKKADMKKAEDKKKAALALDATTEEDSSVENSETEKDDLSSVENSETETDDLSSVENSENETETDDLSSVENSEAEDSETDVPIVDSLPTSHRRYVSESVHHRFTKSRVESILGESIPTYINNLPDDEKEAFKEKFCKTIFKMCWEKYKHGQGIDEWLYTTAGQSGFRNLTSTYLELLWDKLPTDDVIGGAVLKEFIDDNMIFSE